MILSGAQILIEELIRHGTKTTFGYPGGTVLDIYDALYKNAHRIEHILFAHEQGAAHAADGYARVTGEPGVVIATSGPGATNLVTGIANAYLDSVPVIAITGNVSIPLLGKDSFQEVDIVGITQSVVKHSYFVRDIGDLEFIISEAFFIATTGRKGPVLIDIAKSVMIDSCEYLGNCQFVVNNEKKCADLHNALQAIAESKKPLIYCGGGVIASHAEQEVLALSERISAPICLSMMGLTAVPRSYELNLGMCGMHGKYAAIVTQSKSDLIIAIGVRFSDRATGNVTEYCKNRTIIHIDIDEAELGKNVPAMIDLCGDAKEVLSRLIKELPHKTNDEWKRHALEVRQKDEENPDEESFTPRNIIQQVSRSFPADTIVATDVGQHQMWVMQHYEFETPRTLLTSGGLGAMGFGMGAAIGASLATGKKRTILFTGDGSFGMNLIELATAVSEKTPLLIILLNNGALGMIRQWQSVFYDSRYSSATLRRQTDFIALAKAFGADGCTIESLQGLREVLESGLPTDLPFIIECKIDIEEKVLPMIPPGGSIKNILLT